ncbi:AAA family ATPase [Thiocapsa roseopersicina]|uniref:AAA domain-containing protein, putative AbiEii toxin, Type IV TA system n=1 Tax=Thiocapsa roseopersicina TaxID=1058 RepID=A0A1H3CCW0_THIRO|nr:ATP-binding protein [Thiocapsa roseopersicina]SDX51987.1 AAA domain-containing protein, putative AbiEii toxin, Type IV TA system [Thiocapsa roseopersicina]
MGLPLAAMLTRLRVNGFKNLIGVDIHFGPFTCIAGINAVGKSNLFDAILFLKALMDAPIMDAAMEVRDDRGSVSDVGHLFTQTAKGITLPIEIEAQMLVPGEGSDYLGQPAQAKTTFLSYRVVLRHRPPDATSTRSRVDLVEETLIGIAPGEAKNHLPFPHTQQWRASVVRGRRTSPYISTETPDPKSEPPQQEPSGDRRMVKLHQDSPAGGGRARLFQAEKLPRTVLSAVNAQESPTAVLARQEILSWHLLQLEPSALRTPDRFDAPTVLAPSGAHLPATLFRLSARSAEQTMAELSNRLGELIDHVGQVRVDRDERRELLTVLLTDRYGTELPAKALSDGTLRFLALASVEIDPTLTGLICMEEPENGIHPERIAAMLDLLRDIAVDPSLPVGEDNPLRQVIVNTHSPIVVRQVPEDAVIFAVPEQRSVQGSIVKGVSFRCLSGTWRSSPAGMPEIAKGKAIAFLQPIAERGDAKRKGAERRVMDRDDLQLLLDL